MEQKNVFAKKRKNKNKTKTKNKKQKKKRKENKLYCTVLITCSLDNDAAYVNQEIDDKRIVAISNVEDQINTSAKFCKLSAFHCKPKGWLVSIQWKLCAEIGVPKF